MNELLRGWLTHHYRWVVEQGEQHGRGLPPVVVHWFLVATYAALAVIGISYVVTFLVWLFP